MKGAGLVVLVVILMAGTAPAQCDFCAGKGKHDREEGERYGRGRESAMANRGAFGGPGGGMINRLVNNPRIVEKLGLTEDQIETIEKQSESLQAKEEKLGGQLRKIGKKQAKLMMADEIDEEAVMKLIENGGNIRTELGKLRVKQLLLIKRTLTEEQSESLRKMRERMQKARFTEEEHGRRGWDRFRRDDDDRDDDHDLRGDDDDRD